jgi:hypothetical protein
MKFDTVEKAKRILPSFAMHLANGITDLGVLRHRVEGEHGRLTTLMMIKMGERPACLVSEVKEIDRKRIQLTNFLENTRPE